MNILKEFGKMEKKEKALLLTGQSGSMKEIQDGTTGLVSAFVHYEENGSDLLAVRLLDGEWFTTNSKAFIRSFLAIASCYEGEQFYITKISGTSRSGRQYIDCTPA